MNNYCYEPKLNDVSWWQNPNWFLLLFSFIIYLETSHAQLVLLLLQVICIVEWPWHSSMGIILWSSGSYWWSALTAVAQLPIHCWYEVGEQKFPSFMINGYCNLANISLYILRWLVCCIIWLFSWGPCNNFCVLNQTCSLRWRSSEANTNIGVLFFSNKYFCNEKTIVFFWKQLNIYN